ncbi:MAG: asparagine synthase-related protein [Nitrososphaeria archaeon]
MESDVFSKTNGYCIFFGRKILASFIRPIINLMEYRKKEKIVFYDGLSFKEALEDLRPNGVISCFFPSNESNLSSALIHGRIFDQERNQRRIREMHHLITKNGIKNCAEQSFSLDIDGDFSIAIVDGGQLLALRSPISSKPLYFFKGDELFVLTSDPYSLHLLGLQCDCLPSGSILHARFGERIDIHTIRYYHMETSNKKDEGLEDSARTLKSSLEYSVHENLRGIKRVGVAFSGGLDSTVLAKLIESFGVTPILFTVCAKDSHDSVRAKKVADLLSLDNNILYVNSESVEKRIMAISRTFGKMSAMDFSISLVLNLVAEEAARVGLEQVVIGQGADELLGGYQKYTNILRTCGATSLEDTLKTDFEELHCHKISRDEASVSMFAEPIMPFINKKVAETAFSLPVDFKINSLSGERKVVLRSVAKELGLSEEIYLYPKKAMQYSSGIQKLVSKTMEKD